MSRMKAEYIIGLVLLGLVGGGLVYVFTSDSPTASKIAGAMPSMEEPYKEIAEPAGFVNTPTTSSGQATPITIGELVGEKVILVDFMTYSCINCQRTFPYLVAWYEKYKDQGLEIVGIHTPEFAFEKNIDNVREAMAEFGIEYPVVLDNDYATWRAYDNHYWPRKYLVDIHGNIVYDHIGEGAYETTEMKIQELLAERAQVLGEEADMGGELAASSVEEVEIATRSPETYFGSLRNEYLANGTRRSAGEQTLVVPEDVSGNALYLGGTWDIQPEHAESIVDATVMYRYNAKEVYIVADADASVAVEVWQDGVPAGAAVGADVNEAGIVEMQESRLYKLIKNAELGEHTLELRVKGSGLRFYAFTFG